MRFEGTVHAAGGRRARAVPGRARATALLWQPPAARPPGRSFRFRLGRGVRWMRRLTRPLVFLWAVVAVVCVFAPPQYGLRADVKFLFGVLLPSIDLGLAAIGLWGRDQ